MNWAGVSQGGEKEGVEVAVHAAHDVAKGVDGGLVAGVFDEGEDQEVAGEFDQTADEDKEGVVGEGVLPSGARGEDKMPIVCLEMGGEGSSGESAQGTGEADEDGTGGLVAGAAAAVELQHHVEAGDVLTAADDAATDLDGEQPGKQGRGRGKSKGTSRWSEKRS